MNKSYEYDTCTCPLIFFFFLFRNQWIVYDRFTQFLQLLWLFFLSLSPPNCTQEHKSYHYVCPIYTKNGHRKLLKFAYRKFHCQYTFSTMPPPLLTARCSVSEAGGIPQSSGTATVIFSFSCKSPLIAFSATTTCQCSNAYYISTRIKLPNFLVPQTGYRKKYIYIGQTRDFAKIILQC